MEKIDQQKADLLMETCLLAGKILMESTAEMYRVEDTLAYIAQASGCNIVSYTTQTGIFVGIDGMSLLRMAQITKRSINLDKVTKVNQLSREYVRGDFDLEELKCRLVYLQKEQLFFPKWLEILSAALISASMMILFGGKMNDFLLTFLIGGSAYSLFLYSVKHLQIRFLSEFIASWIIGLLVFSASKLGLVHNLDLIMIGCVMPFLPGVAITNSVRDLLAGHLLSGISRGAEALITACMIGFGIAFVFQLLY